MTTTMENVAVPENAATDRRRALGRGLEALLPGGPRVVSSAAAAPASAVTPEGARPAVLPDVQAQAAAASSGSRVVQVPLDQIEENPYQTRQSFDAQTLQELADSIRANGVVQPVVVRPTPAGRFVLILGERRCRASKLAGKTTIPAIVRSVSDEQAAEMTIVENLQRQDLNCVEQANAFARLSREFGLTQEQIGQRTGMARESVSNYMRLLKLPKSVLDLIGAGHLGFSEARVLLEAVPHTTPGTIELLARSAAEGGLTVRHLKMRVEQLINPELHAPEPPKEKVVDPNVRDAERRLREALGMRVRVLACQGNKGQIMIRYESLADFDRILELLSRDE